MISPFSEGTLGCVQAVTQRFLLLCSALVAPSRGGRQSPGARSFPAWPGSRPGSGSWWDLPLPLPLSLSLSAGGNEDLINAGTLAQVPFSRL